MANTIQQVAVLGSGLMGGQIAALFASIDIPVLLYDVDQETADENFRKITRLKPPALFDPAQAKFVTTCNYEEDLEIIADADWVIEAVVERQAVKQDLYRRIEPFLKPEAILSTNTYGLSREALSGEMSPELAERFLITHFYNPPRYSHLLEIVPGPETRPGVVETIAQFCDHKLGKGIVFAKDTPNFIAHRIGIFFYMMSLHVARSLQLSVETIDQVSGIITGYNQQALCRMADRVGVDTLALAARTCYEHCPDDEARMIFQIPDYMQAMLKHKWLGQKTAQGFYKRENGKLLALNPDRLSYRPLEKPAYESIRRARKQQSTPRKIQALIGSQDAAGQFAWEILANTFIYAANRIPEIADDVLAIDNAVRWGLGWRLGPFELWDAVGFQKSAARIKAQEKKLPLWIEAMQLTGSNSFYRQHGSDKQYFDITSGKIQAIPARPRVLPLAFAKSSDQELPGNDHASLVDLGDGVLCAAFHHVPRPEQNFINPATLDILEAAFSYIPGKGYQALVLANPGENFSAGLDLRLLLKFCHQEDWEAIEMFSKRLQDIGQRLRYAPFPVVSVPRRKTSGSGLALALAADIMIVAAESYCGLPESRFGLIPPGGGCLRLLENAIAAGEAQRSGPFPPVRKAFEAIANARISTSALEARQLGFLRERDRVVMNPDHLIYEAKQAALKLAEDYTPPAPREKLQLPGEGGRIALEVALEQRRKTGRISDHDFRVAQKLAYVLTGGERANAASPVDEQTILDLERAAFLRLCQETKTRDRIAHLLKTGKPLRN